MIKINLNTYIITLNKLIEDFKEYTELNPVIIKGIDGKKNNKNSLENNNFNKLNLLPKSVVGCALSHIKCWKKHILKKNNYTLILEDDFFIEDKTLFNNLQNIIKFFISQTPTDFDILYLGYIGGNFINNCFNILNKSNTYLDINSYIAKPSIALGLHSYILSDSGIVKLLSNIENNKINFHLDYYIQSLYSKNLIKSYITKPRIFYQTSTYNNISLNSVYYKCPFFTDYYIDKYVNLNYLLNVSLFQIYDYNISIWILFICLFIILSIIKVYKKYNLCNIKNNNE